MPFEKLHAARQRDPDDFVEGSIRTVQGGRGVLFLVGELKETGDRVEQSVRFQADRWTESEARTWLEENGFDASVFEVATGERSDALDEPEGEWIRREDRGALGTATRRDADGALVVIGTPATSGVLVYGERREWVPPSTVVQSRNLYENVSITIEHPKRPIGPDNQHLVVGSTGSNAVIVWDGDRCENQVAHVLRDRAAISTYETGERRGLSPRYDVRVVERSGRTPDGETYTHVQVERRRVNHVAIVKHPRGQAARLDSGGEMPETEEQDRQDQGEEMLSRLMEMLEGMSDRMARLEEALAAMKSPEEDEDAGQVEEETDGEAEDSVDPSMTHAEYHRRRNLLDQVAGELDVEFEAAEDASDVAQLLADTRTVASRIDSAGGEDDAQAWACVAVFDRTRAHRSTNMRVVEDDDREDSDDRPARTGSAFVIGG